MVEDRGVYLCSKRGRLEDLERGKLCRGENGRYRRDEIEMSVAGSEILFDIVVLGRVLYKSQRSAIAQRGRHQQVLSLRAIRRRGRVQLYSLVDDISAAHASVEVTGEAVGN